MSKILTETNSCQRHEVYCDDQRCDSNSCCDPHMLGNILCNQLLVSHLVVTFSVGDYHDSHLVDMRCARVVPSNKMNMFSCSIDLSFNPTDHQSRQREKACSIETTRPVCHKNFVTIRARKCHDQKSDQELDVTKRSLNMLLVHQLVEFHPWSSRVVYVSYTAKHHHY